MEELAIIVIVESNSFFQGQYSWPYYILKVTSHHAEKFQAIQSAKKIASFRN